MSRDKNWQTKLSNYIRECETKSFDFPTWNCALFAADAVKLQIKLDPLKEIRGKFDNELGAAKQLQLIYNLKTVQDVFRKQMAKPLKSVAFARPGDIVFMSNPVDFDLPVDIKMFGPVPGLCYGQQSYFLGEHGLIRVETLSLGSTLWVS